MKCEVYNDKESIVNSWVLLFILMRKDESFSAKWWDMAITFQIIFT